MDETKIHELAKRVGGRFKLASLIQRRLLELNRGQQTLVQKQRRSPMDTVLDEIDNEKIDLIGPEAEPGTEESVPGLEPSGETREL